MFLTSPAQVRAARGFLNWTQKQLAECADVSLTVISEFEDGKGSPRKDTLDKFYKAFEKHGVELTNEGGIKPRNDKFVIFDGPDACEKLFNDILEILDKNGGEVLAYFDSYKVLAKVHGPHSHSILERLTFIQQIAPVKCIVSDTGAMSALPQFEMRIAAKADMPGVFNFLVYGDKYAMLMNTENADLDFAVFNGTNTAKNVRSQFLTAWNDESMPAQVSRIRQIA